MRTEVARHINRREFLSFVAAFGASLLPNLEVFAGTQANFRELVEKSGNYEPERVYPIISSLPLELPTEYMLPAGGVMDITEKELVSVFKDLIITTDTNLYSSFDGTHYSTYYVSHPVNLDPKLYEGKL